MYLCSVPHYRPSCLTRANLPVDRLGFEVVSELHKRAEQALFCLVSSYLCSEHSFVLLGANGLLNRKNVHLLLLPPVAGRPVVQSNAASGNTARRSNGKLQTLNFPAGIIFRKIVSSDASLFHHALWWDTRILEKNDELCKRFLCVCVCTQMFESRWTSRYHGTV